MNRIRAMGKLSLFLLVMVLVGAVTAAGFVLGSLRNQTTVQPNTGTSFTDWTQLAIAQFLSDTATLTDNFSFDATASEFNQLDQSAAKYNLKVDFDTDGDEDYIYPLTDNNGNTINSYYFLRKNGDLLEMVSLVPANAGTPSIMQNKLVNTYKYFQELDECCHTAIVKDVYTVTGGKAVITSSEVLEVYDSRQERYVSEKLPPVNIVEDFIDTCNRWILPKSRLLGEWVSSTAAANGVSCPSVEIGSPSKGYVRAEFGTTLPTFSAEWTMANTSLSLTANCRTKTHSSIDMFKIAECNVSNNTGALGQISLEYYHDDDARARQQLETIFTGIKSY